MSKDLKHDCSCASQSSIARNKDSLQNKAFISHQLFFTVLYSTYNMLKAMVHV